MTASVEETRFELYKDEQTPLYVLRFLPPFSFYQIELAERALYSRDNYDAAIFRLYDFSDCVGIALTTTALFAIVREASDWKLNLDTRVAFVAGSQSDAGLLRIYASSVGNRPMRVFMGENEARRWLFSDLAEDQPEPNMLLAHQVVQLRGAIHLDHILAEQQRLRDRPDYNASQPVLWDLRDAQFQDSIDDVTRIGTFMANNHARDRSGQRSAILIDSHLMGLYVRELMKATNWPANDVQMYRSYKEALTWLGQPTD